MTTISGVTAVATSASRQLTKNMTTVAPTIVSTFWKKKIEAVAEEEADGLQVDRRARQQLARLVPVVEAEREPEQLRVERVPHVELDAERLAARDQAAAGHEQRAGGADDEDGDGDSVELADGCSP